MSRPDPLTAYAATNGHDIFHGTIRLSRSEAERAWARDFGNIRPGDDSVSMEILDRIWRENAEALGISVIQVTIT
ncbi:MULTISPECIES: hypothetical protein [Methylobacterium]|jgi:hypothetical protein|uniref:Uncharacterized protein n=1 Tax=Methylobacterium jeotgali TaxID=381630 RepID=A0ABQ4SY76_9HYPH|nr:MULTISPECIES: hypothetical protein [Methylobacterium]PIU05693.1 MAG: hypothetical protein COT56_13695 [Methylobacterium sp. CG09_land_8_20_14_0_10_71_15]PIU12403.1 MAG: hypothetical protein COT28_15540 [Methylobacterium sp. CG08_land_8_20_14_0_20_71_15]GBU16919.1 hypothetical protein AwMethylo_11340 [Methylobacterium sp.]GJE06873.1 hypothetical protein AOPFMNJM_2195 [Methylobacterium jeotgali]